jgi:hypothetical protein
MMSGMHQSFEKKEYSSSSDVETISVKVIGQSVLGQLESVPIRKFSRLSIPFSCEALINKI